MYRRILAIIHKEYRHIHRDPRTLAIVFAMPVMMVLLYGYALNMDIDHIPLAVEDRDHTQAARDLADRFDASPSFDIAARVPAGTDADRLFLARSARALLVIPRGYAADLTRGKATIQLVIDGSDPTYGNTIAAYGATIATGTTIASRKAAPVDIRVQYRYNPDLKGSHFIIPGLVAVILMMVCTLLTSITIAREKETGTMDVLLVSPVHPAEIIIGKVIPYIILALVDAVFILAFAKLVFDIPLGGSMVLLTGLTVLYIACALGIGLVISSAASTQQIAMMAALVATILPAMILSGFIFPIFSMPSPIRFISSMVPARYYMIIIRGILLKSNTLAELARPALCLAALCVFFVGVAIMRFRIRRS